MPVLVAAVHLPPRGLVALGKPPTGQSPTSAPTGGRGSSNEARDSPKPGMGVYLFELRCGARTVCRSTLASQMTLPQYRADIAPRPPSSAGATGFRSCRLPARIELRSAKIRLAWIMPTGGSMASRRVRGPERGRPDKPTPPAGRAALRPGGRGPIILSSRANDLHVPHHARRGRRRSNTATVSVAPGAAATDFFI